MRTIIAASVCLFYSAVIVAFVPMFTSTTAPWFIAAWSVAFVWCYLAPIRGRAVVALVVVAIVTVVLPIGYLFASGWYIYRSWSVLSSSLGFAFEQLALLDGIGFFMPLVAATCCVALMRWRRPRHSVDRP